MDYVLPSLLKKQYTLLMCAARNNRLDVVNFLLETLEELQVDVTDSEQQTGLFHAAIGGHHDVVRRLIEAGARADTRDKNRRTPLHAACERGHVEVAELLLRQEGVDREARDEDGNAPLHVAAENQQTSTVQLLLDNACPPDPENAKGYTPLHLASSLGCRGIIELLVQHGGALDRQSKNGNTPLHVACLANELETAELLICKGADVNSLNVRLQSAMHIAAEQGYTELCKLLLSAGANLEQKEQGGKTPLYIAARGSFTTIVDMIIKTARLDYPTVRTAGLTKAPDKENSSLHNQAPDALLPETTALFTPTSPTHKDEQQPDVTDNELNSLNTAARRKWRLSRDEGRGNSNERLREILWKVSYKQLSAGEWKRLAYHWSFTDEQIKAIEHQYTGPASYKEHGFRMMLIWAHGLGPEVNPIKELYEALTAIDKKTVADALRRKLDEENAERCKSSKHRCTSCSIT
ncbi:hypothetical protein B566_EDAN010066 [Ephemera danica]|nr:hypothetical protein B566_EDAN010066 [Ephemera danica]